MVARAGCRSLFFVCFVVFGCKVWSKTDLTDQFPVRAQIQVDEICPVYAVVIWKGKGVN